MLLITVFVAWLAFHYSSPKLAERAVESLQGSGARVLFDYQRLEDDSTYSHQIEPPGPASIRRIAGTGFFEDAEWIVLSGAKLPVEALEPLADLPSVRKLTLTNCGISDEHMMHFQRLYKVDSLDLKSNQITDAGLVHLRGMLQLQTLSLPKNQIRGDGLKHLRGFGQLKELFLHDNPVSDENLVHLGQLINLEMLGLGGTKVTDDGLIHFANLKNLRYLGLTRTNVTDAGSEQLRRLLPDCEVEH